MYSGKVAYSAQGVKSAIELPPLKLVTSNVMEEIRSLYGVDHGQGALHVVIDLSITFTELFVDVVAIESTPNVLLTIGTVSNFLPDSVT